MPYKEMIGLFFRGGGGYIYIYTRNGPAQARVMMKSVLSSAEHGRCPHKY